MESLQSIKPRVEAFVVQKPVLRLVPSPVNRAWMDNFPDRHPYRCLPLSIANAHGWDVLTPIAFELEWNGGKAASDLIVRPHGQLSDGVAFDHFARSHFTHGIVTLHTSYMFRTPPHWNLFVSGPFNSFKHGIAPLTGIVETDWLPYPFTMNWQMTEPGIVKFEKDEPFCTIMPIPKNYLEEWDFAVHDLTDDPVLNAEQTTFREERNQFMEKMHAKDPETLKQAWQKHYFVGRHPDGTAVDNHSNKIRLAAPKNLVGQRPLYAKDKPSSDIAAKVMSGEVTYNTASKTTQNKTEPAKQVKNAPVISSASASSLTISHANTKPTLHTPASPSSNSSLQEKLWAADSLLNHFEQEQQDSNRDGRARLQAGILTPSARTKHLSPASDLSALDFVMVPNFLSQADCKKLVDAARALENLNAIKNVKDPYWQGRMLYFREIATRLPAAASIMLDANRRTAEAISAKYKLIAPIYADLLQIVQWKTGMFMEPHADRANPDHSPHITPHRDFGCVVYLNDDYDGGELYFTRLDQVIKPQAGMLLAFTGGWHHEHAVLKVTAGLRLTMPSFFSFDIAKRDPMLYA